MLPVLSLLASFAMAYAMANLGWKFYFINASWNFVFLIIAYFTFVETKGLKLEEINALFGDASVTDGIEAEQPVSEGSIDGGKGGKVLESSRELPAKEAEA